MNKTAAFLGAALLMGASLTACITPGTPTGSIDATQDTTQPNTPIVQTLNVGTQTVHGSPLPPTPTFTPQPQDTASPIIKISPTATEVCNRAGPGNPLDVTIPDDTELKPNQSFTKTWRLINVGGCTWTRDYALIWFSGEQFSAPKTIYIPHSVSPGQAIEISLDMVAPQSPGTYQSNWMLESPAGGLFGLGPNGDAAVWVRLVVAPIDQPTTSPTPLPSPTDTVYVSGLANLRLDQSLDLDSNTPGTTASEDILFKQVNDNSFQLVPMNGTGVSVYGVGAPEVSDCQSAGLSADPILLDGMGPGTYLCYRTNQGLPGNARLVFLNTTDRTLSLEIVTWSIP